MTFKEIQELIKLVNKSNLTEFKMKEKDFEITIRTKKYGKGTKGNTVFQAPPAMMPMQAPVAPAPQAVPAASPSPVAAPAASAPAEAASSNLLEIRSPIVGTFYRSASPDKPPYASVGDTISVGSVVCIVEAMKLFNEIESEVSGKIVKIMLEDAQPVEYDQVLFIVEPN